MSIINIIIISSIIIIVDMIMISMIINSIDAINIIRGYPRQPSWTSSAEAQTY